MNHQLFVAGQWSLQSLECKERWRQRLKGKRKDKKHVVIKHNKYTNETSLWKTSKNRMQNTPKSSNMFKNQFDFQMCPGCNIN